MGRVLVRSFSISRIKGCVSGCGDVERKGEGKRVMGAWWLYSKITRRVCCTLHDMSKARWELWHSCMLWSFRVRAILRAVSSPLFLSFFLLDTFLTPLLSTKNQRYICPTDTHRDTHFHHIVACPFARWKIRSWGYGVIKALLPASLLGWCTWEECKRTLRTF